MYLHPPEKNPENDLSPEVWVWKIIGGQYIPIMTDLPPAPQKLLEVVRCTCQTGCITISVLMSILVRIRMPYLQYQPA